MNDFLNIKKCRVDRESWNLQIAYFQRNPFESSDLRFLSEDELIMKLHFPQTDKQGTQKRVHENNYEYFVKTMADMIQKYAPEFEAEME